MVSDTPLYLIEKQTDSFSCKNSQLLKFTMPKPAIYTNRNQNLLISYFTLGIERQGHKGKGEKSVQGRAQRRLETRD